MDKVMVIGAGRGQIPIINLFHKYGYFVIVVSVKGDYPGFQIADDCLYTDIRDYDVILDYARNNNIKACLTDQLDEAVSTVAYVSEKLGLKGISVSISRKFTDKYIMRQEANKIGIPVPKSILLSSEDDIRNLSTFSFPIMIKPVDSSASHGIFKVENIEDLIIKYEESKKYSKKNLVIAEEFIVGKEYVVDSFTKDFKVTNLIVGERRYFDIPNTFIPSATIFKDSDSANSEVEEILKETNEKLITGFGLPFGITHAEYIYDETTKKAFLVEIAARGGGVFISSDLIPLACGIDANDLLVREVLDLPIELPLKLQTGASAYFCYLIPKGIIKRIKGTDDVERIPGVSKAFFDNVHLDMESRNAIDKSSRKGPILVFGKEKKDCLDIFEKIKSILDINIVNGTSNCNIIWE